MNRIGINFDQTILDISSQTNVIYNTEILKEQVSSNFQKFNRCQSIAYQEILQTVNLNNDKKKSNLFFIDGPGGTGKTFIYNTLLAEVRSRKESAIALASTGVAALLLDNGHTAHSVFKIPLKCHESSMCNIKANTLSAKIIRETKLFIWDEAPIMSKYVFETVDRTFREIMKSVSPELEKIPFGGKIIVFGGDFRQFLPIVPHGNQYAIVSQCLNRSYLWKNIKKLKLTENMRLKQSDDIHNPEQLKFA